MTFPPPIAWLLPLHPEGGGVEVTSGFGRRKLPDGTWQNHTGIDLRAPTGTPIVAVQAGKVYRLDVDGLGKGVNNGNAILLSCAGWLVCYLHLSAVRVGVGDVVTPGQILGETGATGRARGAHLHFQVYTPAQTVVDPATLYPASWLRPA